MTHYTLLVFAHTLGLLGLGPNLWITMVSSNQKVLSDRQHPPALVLNGVVFLFVFVNVPWNTTLKQAHIYTRVGTINLVQPRLHSAESVIQTEITISCWDLPILLTVSQHPRFSLIPSSFCPSPSVIALQHVSRSIQTLTPLKVKLAFGTPKEFLRSLQKTHCQHDLTTLCHRKCKTVNLLCLFA